MSESGSEGAAEFSPPSLDEAAEWMDEHLLQADIERAGDVTLPYVRPWAAVFAARTTIGSVWLKVPAPDNCFEAGIYRILAEVTPDHVLTPIASDLETGWLLLPDGGPALADVARGEELVEAMMLALPQYAGIQRDMSSMCDELLDLGLADLRPHHLPDHFESAVSAMSPPPRTLVGMVPSFAEWCHALTSLPIGPSLDHNDLHPWNILGLGPDDYETGTAIFYDWGDSIVAHPFGSSLEPISRVRRILRLGADHPHVLRMRDACLEVFDDIIPRAESVELIEVAWRVAKAARAVVWSGQPEDVERYIGDVVAGDSSI